MIPFFSIDANWNRATRVIDSWMGTPYRHLWMKKKRGVDCGLFVGAILAELGVIKEVEFDFYPKQWFVHSDVELVRPIFVRNICNQLIPEFELHELNPLERPLLRGDILGFATVPATGVTHHIAVLLDPPKRFVHCVQSRGVSEMQFGGFWEKRLTMLYRVFMTGD